MFSKSVFAAVIFSLSMSGALQAQDAMGSDAMAGDSMAMDAMAPMMTDDELASCLEQAQAITFPDVVAAAEHACHAMHNAEPVADDAMAGDAMAGDAMAPAQ